MKSAREGDGMNRVVILLAALTIGPAAAYGQGAPPPVRPPAVARPTSAPATRPATAPAEVPLTLADAERIEAEALAALNAAKRQAAQEYIATPEAQADLREVVNRTRAVSDATTEQQRTQAAGSLQVWRSRYNRNLEAAVAASPRVVRATNYYRYTVTIATAARERAKRETVAQAKPEQPAAAESSAGSGSSGGGVSVRGYTRKDGTYVQPHQRSSPSRGRK